MVKGLFIKSLALSFIEKWKETGGVLVLGYEMFRMLSSKRVAPAKKAKSKTSKTPAQPEVIDVEEEDKNKSLMTGTDVNFYYHHHS